MLTIEIEWAERNSSLPYCRYWADRWEKEEEVVMLPQKPRGTLQNDCWSFLKDRKWERSRFPKSRHHLHFALKVALSSTAPANGLSKFFVEQLAPELIRASAVEVKLNFHEGRKSWSQAAYSSSCWKSKRAGLPLQLPQAGDPNANICCCPGHRHLSGYHQHGQGALLPRPSAAVNSCPLCQCLSSRENPPLCGKASKPQNKNWEIGGGSLLRSDHSSLPFLTYLFFFISSSLMCLLWFCKKWLEKLKAPNFSSFTHMCCAPQARQHILVARLRRTFTTLPLKNSLYFSCWAGSHPMWHSSVSHGVTAAASMETHQSMRPVTG